MQQEGVTAGRDQAALIPDAAASLRSLRLVRELGTGSHGTVWLARVEEPLLGLADGDRVAVKFLRQELARDARWIARLRREAEIGCRILHPNVIRIFGLVETELFGLPLVSLVMEHVAGRTVRASLDEHGAAIEPFVRRVGLETAAGLGALHEQGFVHRDIKPENLFLTDAGITRIVDLGFAKQIPAAAARGSGSIAGTLAYVAPECLRGRPGSPASDLYALGVVLYELATGRHPFLEGSGTTADDLIRAQLNAKPVAPSQIRPRLSPFLDQIVLALLHKEPRKRPRSAAALAQILAEGEAGRWWQEHERTAPLLHSLRRLRVTRRPVPTAFYGRAEERDVLERSLQLARTGRCQVVHLEGPEGAGKRRLVDEWVAEKLREPQAPVYFAGQPATGTQEQPISPLCWFLGEHYARLGTAQPDKLARRLQQEAGLADGTARRLARYLLGVGPDASLPAAAATCSLAAIGSRDRPLLMRIHAADRLDAEALNVLAGLTHARPAHGLVILCTHREAAGPHLDGIQHERIDLGPLDPDATRQFVGELFADEREADRAFDFLTSQLAPLPGLILECLELLRQRRQLAGRPGGYHDLHTSAVLPVAGRLRHFLLASWQRLDPGQRALLEAAAVLGDPFRLEDLAAMTGTGELEALEQVSALRDRWILSERPRLRFRRRSQRQVILAEISQQRRIELHRRAAHVLGQRGARPFEIAMQWSRGQAHERALPGLLDAAEAFLARADLERAALLLAHVEEHRTASGAACASSETRYHLLRAEYRLAAGQPEAAEEDLEVALRSAPRERDAELAARCRAGLARAARDRGCMGEALGRIEAALPLFPAGSDARLASALMQAELQGVTGNLRAALKTAARVHDELQARGATGGLPYAKATTELARIEAARWRVPLAERHYREAEACYRALGDELGLVRLALRRAHLHLQLGRGAEVRRTLATLQLPSSREIAHAGHLIALSHFYEGDHARALERCREAKAKAAACGDAFGGIEIRVTELEIETELGMASVQNAVRIEKAARRSSIPRAGLRAARLQACLLRASGEAAAALATLEEALAVARRSSIEPTLALGLYLEKSASLEALGRQEAARRVRALARRRLERLAGRLRGRSQRRGFLQATPIRRRLLQ